MQNSCTAALSAGLNQQNNTTNPGLIETVIDSIRQHMTVVLFTGKREIETETEPI